MKRTSDMSFFRFRAFQIKYMGPTNTRPARIKITDTRTKYSVKLARDTDFTHYEDQALNYLESIGIEIIGMAVCEDSLLLTTNFTTKLIKK